MKATINVYLTFSGKCREAMEFYQKTLGGELILMTVKDVGMTEQWPESMHNNLVHSELNNGSLSLFASDMGNPEKEIEGNTVSLSVVCESEEQHKMFYEGISQGGSNLIPPHNFPQGRMAALTDKFGKNWTFYFDNVKR